MQFQDSIRSLLQEYQGMEASSFVNPETSRLTEKMIRHLRHQMPFASPGKGDYLSSSTERDNEDASFLNIRHNEKASRTAESMAAAPNLRSVLGSDLSLDEISQFVNLLTIATTDRIDSEDFLPATQDEAANSAAMDGPAAQKLPRHALQTAQLYVQLLQRQGGLGAGFVQASSLTAVVALLKRWRVEIQDVVVLAKGSSANKPSDGKPHETGQERKRSRSRSGLVASSDSSSSDSEEDILMEEDSDNDDQDQSDAELVSSLTPTELLHLGLELCREVARLPLHGEFLGWSSECREAVIEGVSFVLGTCAALTASSKRSAVDASALAMARRAVAQAKESLSECLLITEDPDDGEEEGHDIHNGRLSKLHETLVCICRGLYQLLSWKEILPFGEAGRQASSVAAASTLESLIDGLSGGLSIYPSTRPSSRVSQQFSTVEGTMSPERQSPTNPAFTPKSNRRVRLSLSNSKPKEVVPMTSPKLKSAAKRAISSTTAKSKSRPIFSALVGLLQKLITDVAMEKAVVRNSTVVAVHKCLGSLRRKERQHFLQFLIQGCHSRVPVHRLVSCDIIGRVLAETWLWTEHAGHDVRSPSDSVGSQKSLSPLVIASETDMPTALFGALQGRLSDRVPTVRGTSLSTLSSLLQGLRGVQEASSAASVACLGLSDVLHTEVDELLEILRIRATADARATVRRHAVTALGEIFLWSISELTEYDLALLRDRCQDSSAMTRKAAAEALTVLVESKERCHLEDALHHTWISAVLPLCLETEGTNTNPCLEFVQRLIIVPLVSPEEDNTDSASITKAWCLLAKVGDSSGRQGASRSECEALTVAIAKFLESSDDPMNTKLCLMRYICEVAKSSLENNEVVDRLLDIRRTGVWCVLDAFVRSFQESSTLVQLFKRKSIETDFITTAWVKLLNMCQDANKGSTSEMRLRSCVRKSLFVMASAACALDVDSMGAAKIKLLQMLCDYDIPEDIIGSAVSTLTSITLALAPTGSVEAAHVDCKSWVTTIYESCGEKLSDYIGSHARPEGMVDVSRALYVVGECSLVGFNPSEEGAMSKKEAESLSSKDFRKRGLMGFHVEPSTNLVTLVMSFLSEELAGSANVKIPENVRGYAFLSLGKMCLRDVDLAKRALTVLARELHENMSRGSSVIQCNVLLIMGDLCVRYTSLADRYLPVMAACLQSGANNVSSSLFDSSSSHGFEVVRKSAVILLSSLIMQDYIKWRGLLFHRFLVAASDEDETVSELAENTLSGPLLVKTPKLFFNNFVESFFVLNRCEAHPMYVAAASNGDGGSGIAVGFDGIDLSGEAGRVRRRKMYELMLSKMSDDEKISVTAKIAREVLKGALVEGSDLFLACSKSAGENTSSAYNVLRDALEVLRSDSIRVGKRQSNDTDDIEDPTVGDAATKKIADAKSRLMSKISRKQMIEIIVPILGNLKSQLQRTCSPLLKDLMAYLVDVYSTCKNEVQEVLMNDPTLLQELEYDSRQLKKSQKVRTNHTTPVPQMVFQ
jgi:condensin-2 complex subunit D3